MKIFPDRTEFSDIVIETLMLTLAPVRNFRVNGTFPITFDIVLITSTSLLDLKAKVHPPPFSLIKSIGHPQLISIKSI